MDGMNRCSQIMLTVSAVTTSCFFFSSRRRHTRFDCDWSSDVCSSDLDQAPGSLTPLMIATATSTSVNSMPPALFQKPFGQWTFASAVPICMVTIAALIGTSKPSPSAMPPANSASAVVTAQNRAGRMPMRANPCVHPARPGPPQTPNSFCAPCAAMTTPTMARTSANARSIEMTGVVKVIDDPSFFRRYPGTTWTTPVVFPRKRSPGWPHYVPVLVRIDHIVINVTDFARSNAFYRDVLGAALVEIDGRVAYRIGGQQLNVHGPRGRPAMVPRVPVAPGNSDVCFEWSGSIDDAVAHLVRHGVRGEAGARPRGGGGGVRGHGFLRPPRRRPRSS